MSLFHLPCVGFAELAPKSLSPSVRSASILLSQSSRSPPILLHQSARSAPIRLRQSPRSAPSFNASISSLCRHPSRTSSTVTTGQNLPPDFSSSWSHNTHFPRPIAFSHCVPDTSTSPTLPLGQPHSVGMRFFNATLIRKFDFFQFWQSKSFTRWKTFSDKYLAPRLP